jgi:hypothetical protein
MFPPDPRVEAGPVVGLHNVPAVDLAGAHAAVVGALRPGEPVLGPPKRMTVLGQEGVLLLDAEPGLKVLGLGHDLHALLHHTSGLQNRIRYVRIRDHFFYESADPDPYSKCGIGSGSVFGIWLRIRIQVLQLLFNFERRLKLSKKCTVNVFSSNFFMFSLISTITLMIVKMIQIKNNFTHIVATCKILSLTIGVQNLKMLDT